MELGAFSISLAVQNLQASKTFYEKIDFTVASEADETTTGPTSFVIIDPNDNPILIDQHV